METKEKRTKVLVTVLALAGLLGLSIFATAGVLEPSAAPGPTMKTLDEVEPRTAVNATNTPGDSGSSYKITVAGSYYLTDNVTGVSGKKGIEITADNGTLDPNGVALVGVPGSLRGVDVFGAGLKNITIKNGTISNWGSDGCVTAGTDNSRLERLHASDNGGIGLWSGRNSIVKNCTARDNGSHGVSVLNNSVITGCTAVSNDIWGIFAGEESTVTACTAAENGFYGIALGAGCTVTNCTARNNGSDGINCSIGASTITGCTANYNTGAGIKVESGTVTNCVVVRNSGDGILVSYGQGIVKSCSAALNTGNGIKVAADSYVVANNCTANGWSGDAAGIHVTGSGNRIEGNEVNDNDRGIDVDSGGNLIVKNSASGNAPNYALTGTNTVGPIITATGTITSTNP